MSTNNDIPSEVDVLDIISFLNVSDTSNIEFRLYYDNTGKVITYSCGPAENVESEYIIIDKDIYAEGRFDVRVVDGKIVKSYMKVIISRLFPSYEGQSCSNEDISIISTGENCIKWKLKTYEI